MRTLIAASLLATFAMALSGCASHGSTSKSGDTKVLMLRSGGNDVLRLTAPAKATSLSQDGELDVMSPDGYVEFWVASGARTVDDAVPRVNQVIDSQFKDMKVTGSVTMTIAGAPAKRLMGTGTEADDGDPGTADVVVFTVGGRVFVACTHGESVRTSAQQLMISMVQDAKAP